MMKFILFLLMGASFAFSQEAPSKSVFKGELKITSEKGMGLDSEKRVAVFHHKVVLTQEDLRLTCDEMRVEYVEKNGKMDLLSLQAMGNVICIRPSAKLKVNSDELNYNHALRTFHFKSKKLTTVIQEGNKSTGKEIKVNLVTGRVTSIGPSTLSIDLD